MRKRRRLCPLPVPVHRVPIAASSYRGHNVSTQTCYCKVQRLLPAVVITLITPLLAQEARGETYVPSTYQEIEVPGDDTVLATVNGEAVTGKDLRIVAQQHYSRFDPADEERLRWLLTWSIDRTLLAQEALRRELHEGRSPQARLLAKKKIAELGVDDPSTRATLAHLLLVEIASAEQLRAEPTEEEIVAYLREHPEAREYPGRVELRWRRIEPTEDESVAEARSRAVDLADRVRSSVDSPRGSRNGYSAELSEIRILTHPGRQCVWACRKDRKLEFIELGEDLAATVWALPEGEVAAIEDGTVFHVVEVERVVPLLPLLPEVADEQVQHELSWRL